VINILPQTNYVRQSSFEKQMTDSIYPIKYIDALDCDYQGYVEEFNEKFEPLPALFPPCNNMGGIEKSCISSAGYELTPPPQFSCIVDYLSFTFNLSGYQSGDNSDRILILFDELLRRISHLKLITFKTPRGLYGYKQSIALSRNGLQVGLIGFDGNNDSCLVSLSGQGCLGVDMYAMCSFMESLPRCKITRIDLAHDDLVGDVSVRDYKKLYESGGFSIKGTAPKSRYMDDMGSGAGCTLYVGKKVNGKEACIYEKGRQLGDETSPWVRIEVRFAAVDRIIPFETMTQPAKYLAASYPPFAYISATHALIAIIKKAGEIALEHLIEHASIGYGRLFNYMKKVGYSAEQIIDKISREGVPKRLLIPDSALQNCVPF